MGSYSNVTDASVRAASIAADREESWRRAQGIIAETCHRYDTAVSNVLVSGTFEFAQIYVRAGEILANSAICTNAAGSAQTLGRIGLYDTSGALLASCADTTTAWSSVGIHTQAFTTPYTVSASGILFIGIIMVAGTTVPSILASRNPIASSVGLVQAVSGPILFGSQAGLSDLPGPLTVAAGTAPGAPWIAVF